jgi:hypothetical protein
MHGRLAPLALAALAPLLLLGAGGGDDDPTSTTTAETTTTAPWPERQRQAVIDARQALWLDGRPAPPPPERLEVETVVAVEEVDGAQLAVLTTCAVVEQGATFDIFGGLISEGGGYTTHRYGEILGTVNGAWQWTTRLAHGARILDGEAGCATD